MKCFLSLLVYFNPLTQLNFSRLLSISSPASRVLPGLYTNPA